MHSSCNKNVNKIFVVVTAFCIKYLGHKTGNRAAEKAHFISNDVHTATLTWLT